MKKYKFDNKEYSIPTEWCEVSVGMLIQASLLEEITEGMELPVIISAYTQIPLKDLRLSSRESVLEILSIMEFISTPYEARPSNEFIFNGEKYSAKADIVDQNFEDWISIQTVLHNYKDEPVKGLTKLVAIMCKKDGEDLDSFNLTERAKQLEDMSMCSAKDVEAFFLHSKVAYEVLILLSSTTNEQELVVLHKVAELQNTMRLRRVQRGTSLLMKLLIGYYQIYLWYLKSLLVKYFSFTRTKPSEKNSTKTSKI